MTAQMLFYQDAVPVTRRRHDGRSVEVQHHAFSSKVIAVPLTGVEFRAAAGEYPIVFVEAGGGMQPMAVLGLRRDENLFVSAAGEWLGRYIPAFVRRYPFVFAKAGDDQRLVLCVDAAFPGVNAEGRGQPLFTADGQPSPYVGQVLRFLQEYRAQFLRTRAFCRRLQELELFEPVQARMADAGLVLGGFARINRDKLRALPGNDLEELARNDGMELLYLHLQSLGNFGALRKRLPAAPAPQQELAAMAAAAAEGGGPVTIH